MALVFRVKEAQTLAHENPLEIETPTWPRRGAKVAATKGASPNTERDAIIFIPGLAAEWGDTTLEDAAHRMTAALDRNAATGSARFSVDLQVGEEEYGNGQKTRMCTISRSDGEDVKPVADVFVLSYNEALTARFEKRNLVVKAVLVLLAIARHVLPVFRALLFGKRSGKTLKETVQVVYAVVILLLLAGYIGVLIWALIQTARGLPALSGESPDVSLFQAIVVGGAGVGAFLPSLREWISRAAVSYISLIYYIAFGERSEVIAGRLASLLEHIVERSDSAYRQIHILAYSFGTIVALDSVFPKGRDPGQRFALIDTLVTIGTPHDAIRSWWPHHFSDRHAHPGRPAHWINVYAPADILGSNFRNDGQVGHPTQPILLEGGSVGISPDHNVSYRVGPPLEKVGLGGIITLVGLRTHGMYWDEEVEAESAYSSVMRAIYQGTPALA